MSSSSKPRKYKTLTLAEKIAAIREVEKGLKKKSEIAKDFGIPQNSLSTYLKNKEKILSNESESGKDRKRMRPPENPDVDECVLKWFKQARDKKIPLSGQLLRAKAEQFASELEKKISKPALVGWMGLKTAIRFLSNRCAVKVGLLTRTKQQNGNKN